MWASSMVMSTWMMMMTLSPSSSSAALSNGVLIQRLAPTATLHPVFNDSNYVYSKKVASVYAGLTYDYEDDDSRRRRLVENNHYELTNDFESKRHFSRFEWQHRRDLKSHNPKKKNMYNPSAYPNNNNNNDNNDNDSSYDSPPSTNTDPYNTNNNNYSRTSSPQTQPDTSSYHTPNDQTKGSLYGNPPTSSYENLNRPDNENNNNNNDNYDMNESYSNNYSYNNNNYNDKGNNNNNNNNAAYVSNNNQYPPYGSSEEPTFAGPTDSNNDDMYYVLVSPSDDNSPPHNNNNNDNGMYNGGSSSNPKDNNNNYNKGSKNGGSRYVPPTMKPTKAPTDFPTSDPTFDPTSVPTFDPTVAPTNPPTTMDPTPAPTEEEEEDDESEDQLPNLVTNNEDDDDLGNDDEIIRDAKKNTMHGGLYNSFQASPLSQGFGTHYSSVWVGTPSQRSTVIVDTGSHYTAFPCKPCEGCGESYHTDKYFDPTLSSSYHNVPCGKDCSGGCRNNKCTISQSYAEGSSWRAIVAEDEFFCSSQTDALAQDREYSIPFQFGCQNHETGLFITQLADGIMGMSAHKATLTHQLTLAGKIEHDMFTMCFSHALEQSKEGVLAGILAMGGVDTRHHTSPMVYAKSLHTDGWYTVEVKSIYMRLGAATATTTVGTPKQLRQADLKKLHAESSKINSGKGVIVDSGTTDTYLSRSLSSEFKRVWKEMTGTDYHNKAYDITEDELDDYPTILVQLKALYSADEKVEDDGMDPNEVVGYTGTDLSRDSPRDVLLAIPPQHYMEYDVKTKQYTPRIYLTESSGGVLGANAMMGHDILFDWENQRIGFAESACRYDYNEEVINVGVGTNDADEHISLDCELGVPSISSTCEDNVKPEDCKDKPKDTMVKSVAKWNMVIENSGSAGGKTCEEIATNDTTPIPGESVFCNPDGLCEKIQPCSTTCADVDTGDLDLQPVMPFIDDDTMEMTKIKDLYCGDGSWGSCQYSCEQTKIVATLMSDGLCHESSKITRKCHIDACGRTDPCRVPFVVHSIILFSGAESHLWDKRYEETFIEAFAITVNRDRENAADRLFEPGDVKVLTASNWYESSRSKEPDGMKLIVEISIFNENAKLPEIEPLEAESNITLNDAANFTESWKDKVNQVVDRVKNVFHSMEGPPLSTCDENDVFPLAKTASDVHVELARTAFMTDLLDEMEDKIDKINTPFSPVYASRDNKLESSVLSSWTIKTEVEIFSQDAPLRVFRNGNIFDHWETLTTIAAVLFFVCYCGVCCGSCCTRRKFRKVSRALKDSKKVINDLKYRMKHGKGPNGKGKYAKIQMEAMLDDDDLEIGEDGPMSTVEFKDHPDQYEINPSECELELPDANTRMRRLEEDGEKENGEGLQENGHVNGK